MTKPYRLFDELNQTNHVCIHSMHACPFCLTKIRVKESIPKFKENVNYIAPFEVVVHNKSNDIWVSFLGKVYNLTPLVKKYKNEKCILPLIAFAGKDLSHWFDDKTGEIQHFIHPVTGVRVPFCPHGPLPHVHEQVPTSKWKELNGKPWWAEDRYLVGLLTARVRPIRIQNTLTGEMCALNVCMEDKLKRIQERYWMFNSDADSYTWCYDDRVLDMGKTLDENNVPDERDKFTSVGLPENTYVPMLLLYYNDDLKWA